MTDITAEQLLALADRAGVTMRPEEARALRAGIEQLTVTVAQLHAGEEPYVHDYAVATPAQWIWLWNRDSLEKRLAMAGAIERDASTARECFMGDHVNRLVELQNAWHEGPGRSHTAVAMAQALAYELDDENPAIAERLRAVIDEAMNGPAPVLVPHAATPPPALLATTRLPPADVREWMADAIIHALKTRTVTTEVYPGGPRSGWGLSGHEIADVVLLELGMTEQAGQLAPASAGCSPYCADSHMYDGQCTEDPHLEGVTTPGHELPHRTGAAWSCAEDDGCGHLSLGHSSEAAARRDYDRHRAKQCPRTDPFDAPVAGGQP